MDSRYVPLRLLVDILILGIGLIVGDQAGTARPETRSLVGGGAAALALIAFDVIYAVGIGNGKQNRSEKAISDVSKAEAKTETDGNR